MKQLINGHTNTHIASADRGLNYGDGLFETVAVHPLSCGIGYRVECWASHWQRLCQGLRNLNFDIDTEALQLSLWQDITSILHDSRELSDHSWVIKIIITRGTSGRGYQPSPQPQINRIVQCLPWPKGRELLAQEGVNTRLCKHRWSSQPALAGLKHLNRLDQVLARAEWRNDYHEGIMLNQQGNVQSGVMSNIFIQLDNQLYTPNNIEAGIAGVMAQQIGLVATQLNIMQTQAGISMAMLQQAQGVFLTNSLNAIWPVVTVDDDTYSITATTRQLQQALAEHLINKSHEIHYG